MFCVGLTFSLLNVGVLFDEMLHVMDRETAVYCCPILMLNM